LGVLAHFEKKTFFYIFYHFFIFLYEIVVLATYSLSIWVTSPLFRLRYSTTPNETRFVSLNSPFAYLRKFARLHMPV